MPTHHNNGLAHKKHKHPSDDGQNQNGKTTESNQTRKCKIIVSTNLIDTNSDHFIMNWGDDLSTW